jgi:hypothetical protein
MDSDKIVSLTFYLRQHSRSLRPTFPQLVLNSGRLVEFGNPKDLLANQDGYFKALVDESPDRAELYVAAGAG